jgi:hypothetical protein
MHHQTIHDWKISWISRYLLRPKSSLLKRNFIQLAILFKKHKYELTINHQNERNPHITKANFTSFWLLVWTHWPWITLTNLCAIHGMMGFCNRFKIWKLLSQLLRTLSVAQHWKGCLLHIKNLPTSCPNFVFWLNCNFSLLIAIILTTEMKEHSILV